MKERWLVIVTLSLALAGSASGQPGSVAIGGGGGWAVPIGELEDRFNDGPAYSAWMSFGVLDNLDLQIHYEQSFLDQRREDEGFLFDATDLTLTTVMAGPRVFFLDPGRPFRPWVGGGLGYTRFEADDAGPGNAVEDDDRFGFGLGGGFDLGGARWAFTAEARYFRSLGSGDEDDFGTIVPIGGFVYRFGP